jgi:hypothetical protein
MRFPVASMRDRATRAPDRLLTRLAQPEVPHLSRVDELLHRAGDVFDGHRRVRAVLVQQVDVVGAEEAEGVLDDVLAPAVHLGCVEHGHA